MTSPAEPSPARRGWRAALAGRRGIAASELALTAPVIGAVMLAGVDLVQFLRMQMRLETAVVQLGQAVSQCRQITTPGDTRGLWAIAQSAVGAGVNLTGGGSGGGAVILTGVRSVGGSNQIAWRERAGNTAYGGRVGTGVPGTAATLQAGFVVPAGQLALVTEIRAPVPPWPLSRLLAAAGVISTTLEATSIYLGRSADLTALTAAPVSSETAACLT